MPRRRDAASIATFPTGSTLQRLATLASLQLGSPDSEFTAAVGATTSVRDGGAFTTERVVVLTLEHPERAKVAIAKIRTRITLLRNKIPYIAQSFLGQLFSATWSEVHGSTGNVLFSTAPIVSEASTDEALADGLIEILPESDWSDSTLGGWP